MSHNIPEECYVVQILNYLSLDVVGYLKTSFHRISVLEYSANIQIVENVNEATCKKSVAEAWQIAEFVILHLFTNNNYTFRVVEPRSKTSVISFDRKS